ncbi:MAG: hypothetical protein IRZ28_10325 [Steroidobacteraceae bacterium]|nr:hypothetical protein [Steroidobacteraceae bacterium]
MSDEMHFRAHEADVQRDLGRIEARLDAGDQRMSRMEQKIDALVEKIDRIAGAVNRARGAWGLLVAGGAIGAAVTKGVAMLKGGGS